MYPSPYHHERPYTGQSAFDDYRCPVCGSTGECPDGAAVPMPYPPFDIDTDATSDATPLRTYTVTLLGYTTTMQLNDSDAARYGDAAVLSLIGG